MKIVFFILVCTLGLPAFAESCRFPEQQPFAITELTRLIRNPECNVKSIDDVLAVIPEHMKSKLALFYRSQSLQGPHKNNFIYPRAILSSVQPGYYPNTMQKALMMSFNGHESQPGFDRLEVADMDPTLPTPNIFNYYEINFPPETTSPAMTWAQAQEKIVISEPNPRRCQECHGLPARPIYQAYPNWIGAFGSRHIDDLSTEESTGLQQFIAAHTNNKQSRYRHLNPSRFSTEAQMYGNQLRTIKDRLEFGGANQTINLNADLSNYNGVRMARVMKSTPIYPYFRYAIAGAFEECASPSSFFPPATLNYLKSRVINRFNIKTTDQAKLNKIFGAIQSAGNSQFGIYPGVGPSLNATIQIHRSTFDNDEGLFAIWQDTMSRQGFDRIATPAVPLRVIFEGMGYSMNNWWTDLKQPTYRINSGFGGHWSRLMFVEDSDLNKIFVDSGMAAAEVAGEYEKYEKLKIPFCQNLAKQSVEALKTLDIQRLALTEKLALPEHVNKNYPQVFQSTCLNCHGDGSIGPRIPFQNEVEMSGWLNDTKNFKRLKYKLVNAPEIERMPPTRSLTDTERKQLGVYLKGFEK